jgi:hypothetical protein
MGDHVKPKSLCCSNKIDFKSMVIKHAEGNIDQVMAWKLCCGTECTAGNCVVEQNVQLEIVVEQNVQLEIVCCGTECTARNCVVEQNVQLEKTNGLLIKEETLTQKGSSNG